VPANSFSVRWEGYWDFPASGRYRFRMTADDGIRIWIDNALILDAWIVQPPTTYVRYVSLTMGRHYVRVDYYEHTGEAVAQVAWSYKGASPSLCVECALDSFNSYPEIMGTMGSPGGFQLVLAIVGAVGGLAVSYGFLRRQIRAESERDAPRRRKLILRTTRSSLQDSGRSRWIDGAEPLRSSGIR